MKIDDIFPIELHSLVTPEDQMAGKRTQHPVCRSVAVQSVGVVFEHSNWLVKQKLILADVHTVSLFNDIISEDLAKLKRVILTKTGSARVVSNAHVCYRSRLVIRYLSGKSKELPLLP